MGSRLRELRESKNMTQEELSEKAGVSRTIIWRLEQDKNHNATTKTLYKIAEALGVTVDSLFYAKSV
jgi:transcriptional regulator with XRE-family HTH domain